MTHAAAQIFWSPPPREWPNVIKFQLLSRFQIFLKPNFVCPLTNERYKTYQTGFSFRRLGHALGVGLEGVQGVLGVNKISGIQPNLVCE